MRSSLPLTIRTVTLAVVGLLSVGSAYLSAQGFGLPESERRGKLQAVVYQIDSAGMARGVSGWIIERADSWLTLDNGREVVRIERSAITHIDLIRPPRQDLPAAAFAGGAFLATHLLVLAGNSSNPDHYRSGNSTFSRLPFPEIIGAGLAGGMLGGTVTSFIIRGIDEERERIEIDEGENQEGWDRLGKRMKSATLPLSVQVTTSGIIAFGSEEAILERHETSGAAFDKEGNIDHIPHQWFRRLRIGYNLSPRFDLGLTVVNPSLPPQAARFVIPHFPADLIRTDIETVIRGLGYGPSAVFRPFGDRGGVEFGLGAGLADIGFYERTKSPHPVTRAIEVDSIEENSLLPFAVINADFSLYLTEGLFASVTADLMLLPSLTPPPRVVGKEVEPEPIPLTSASVGISIGYRF